MIIYLTEDVINEAVSVSDVVRALDDRRAVLINYSDEDASHPGKRYIEPYVYGLTKAGNPCIRAYQYWGDTKRGTPKWKMFRLDRIDSWEPTENTFEIEPKARGWAAEAFNNNGDASMSSVLKIVQLGKAPQTDYERLKARTKQIQNSKPVNINNIDNRYSGPIKGTQPNDDNTTVQSGNTESGTIANQQQTQGAIEEPRIDRNPQGPIVGDATNPQEVSADELMSNDDFRKMLQRNIDITDREKSRRNSIKNSNALA